jgi:hypothetical protein
VRKEPKVYLTAKRYESVIDLEKVAQRVREGLAPMISELPGFVSFDCSDAEESVLVTTSVFETRDSAEESDRRATVWARENLGFLVPHPPQTTAGEVVATGRRVT